MLLVGFVKLVQHSSLFFTNKFKEKLQNAKAAKEILLNGL